MEFVRECGLEFPELEVTAFKDLNESNPVFATPEIPYFKEIYKVYLGYRQCYSRDLESNRVNDVLADTTDYEKYVYLYGSYLQWLYARSTKIYDAEEEVEEHSEEMVSQKFVEMARELFTQHNQLYHYVKMCWFIYNHLNHQSPLEHAVFQFQFRHMSRACQQQLTRHRCGTFNIQSQRFVKFFKEGEKCSPIFYLPPSIARHSDAVEIYTNYLSQLEGVVQQLRELGHKDIKEEDIRYLYPNAMVGDGVWTVNLRSLMHFLNERCCSHAQYEIRQFARGIRNYLCEELPFIGAELGPKCYFLGRCPEKKSCGTIITRKKYIPFSPRKD